MDLANERISTGVNYITADVNNSPAIPNPLIPPSIPDYGPIPNSLTLPDVGPICTLILIPSAVVSKGIEDYINWAKVVPTA
ncbi:hypothetical protein [Clostridium beijerinckii]|uniref:hypothetical protein n=1 Tax=Clostridium beijerinckii TaxID=1520 RepID=UPI0014949650|nr:hypothetical protein [Clostridium beijerinckii]NOW04341.1 hypothetical protein [Clostridium beijerinckii]NYC02518.1 hypothetical protein [Clostridium beijerinckii]